MSSQDSFGCMTCLLPPDFSPLFVHAELLRADVLTAIRKAEQDTRFYY